MANGPCVNLYESGLQAGQRPLCHLLWQINALQEDAEILGQCLDLQADFEANTSIKLAGGVSARDARTLAGQMNTDAQTIQHQPRGTFATFVRGLTRQAVPISFPFFVLEKLPRNTKDEIDTIRQHSREQYAEPWRKAPEHNAPEQSQDIENLKEKDDEDPTSPSPEF